MNEHVSYNFLFTFNLTVLISRRQLQALCFNNSELKYHVNLLSLLVLLVTLSLVDTHSYMRIIKRCIAESQSDIISMQ